MDSSDSPSPAPESNAPGGEPVARDPNLVGIVAYLTIIGWIVALILNNPRQASVSFHIRQSLGLMLIFFLSSVVMVIPILGVLVGFVGYLFAFVLWIIGLIGALQGETRVVPVVGDKFQDWFQPL